jgi:hypothetical protein
MRRALLWRELRESRADPDGLVLLDLAEAWKRQFHEKGWGKVGTA